MRGKQTPSSIGSWLIRQHVHSLRCVCGGRKHVRGKQTDTGSVGRMRQVERRSGKNRERERERDRKREKERV